MTDFLLLNTASEPLTIVSLRRAINLIFLGRAEGAVMEGVTVRGPSRVLCIPYVLRLRFRTGVPAARPRPPGPGAVCSRDGYTCAYCGMVCRPVRRRLTM